MMFHAVFTVWLYTVAFFPCQFCVSRQELRVPIAFLVFFSQVTWPYRHAFTVFLHPPTPLFVLFGFFFFFACVLCCFLFVCLFFEEKNTYIWERERVCVCVCFIDPSTFWLFGVFSYWFFYLLYAFLRTACFQKFVAETISLFSDLFTSQWWFSVDVFNLTRCDRVQYACVVEVGTEDWTDR